MSIYDDNEVATVTTPDAITDVYQHQMQLRLDEWHTRPLEPRLQGGQYLPFIMITVILPVAALIVGWFL